MECQDTDFKGISFQISLFYGISENVMMFIKQKCFSISLWIMTKIILIRHALTDSVGNRLSGRTPGIHLNEEGKQQAARLAKLLREMRIDAIYSSPLDRAIETAEEVATSRDIEVILSEEFLEVDFGSWTNLTIGELKDDPRFRLFNTFRSGTRIPGGELMHEAQFRIVSGLEKICRRHNDQTVAVVSHADMIRSAIAWYAGIPVDLMNRIEISPASVSIIEVYDSAARIILLNGTTGLTASKD